MVADLMTLVKDPLGDLRILDHAVTTQQKGTLRPPQGKSIQQRLGISAGWSVIKGQCHIFFILCPQDRKCKKGNHDKTGNNSPHTDHILSAIFCYFI